MLMKQILTADETGKAIQEMASAILAFAGRSGHETGDLALVGIRSRGVPLALKLVGHIKEKTGVALPVGILDITLYRDDLSRVADHPIIKKTEIPFPVDSKKIFLVDDVLYTGRTIRCAMDALFDLGRPPFVRLAVLVDRGGRELPIQADVAGFNCTAGKNDNINVRLLETDGRDGVECN